MASAFRDIIVFFDKIGVYDVVLPFLLVFTIVFAILEKTKVLGTDKVGDMIVTKKNLNSMIAFVIGFLVVASTKLVETINKAMADMVLVLLLIFSFLLLIGTFYSEKEEVILEGKWRIGFMIAVLIGIILIWLNAIGWLSEWWDYLVLHWDSTAVLSIILIVIIIVYMVWVTRSPKPQGDKHEDK